MKYDKDYENDNIEEKYYEDLYYQDLAARAFAKSKYEYAFKPEYNNAEIMRLRDEGLSYREIAKRLGIPSPSTVRNRVKKMTAV